MPDRNRARLVLMALLVLLTIAGIRGVGPAVRVHLPAHSRIVAIGCALEAVLVVLLVALRWRRAGSGARPRAGTTAGQAQASLAGGESASIGARLRPILSGILVLGLVATPLATLVGTLRKLRNVRPVPVKLLPPVGRGKTPPPGLVHHGSPVSFAIAWDILEVLLIAGVVVVAIVLWRARRPRIRRLDLDGAQVPDAPAELARAVDSGRTALRELGDARAAIIACYLAMESSIARAGAARAAAETPDELLARAAAAQLVDAAPAGRLTGLFYEARFSTHPMPPSRLDEAEQALSELAATLPARTRPTEALPAEALPAETLPAETGP